MIHGQEIVNETTTILESNKYSHYFLHLTNSKCCADARIGNNANICDNGASTCEPENKNGKRILAIEIVVPITVATLLFVAALLILHRLKHKQGNIP